MKRAVVALFVIVSMVGCFPHNARHRTYAKLGEGAAILAGIAISAVANTAADCDQMVTGVNNPDDSCKTGAKWMSTAGVVLVVGGLLGFVATVSTAEQEPAPKPVEAETKPEPKAKPAETPVEQTSNTQATDPKPESDSSAGSGAPSTSAPQSR